MRPAFSPGTSVSIAAPPLVGGTVPASRAALYYLARPEAPYAGSWGRSPAGTEWALTCMPRHARRLRGGTAVQYAAAHEV